MSGPRDRTRACRVFPSPGLVVRVYGAELQQVLDVLAREAQKLPDAHSAERAVLDEAVERRVADLKVLRHLGDGEERRHALDPASPSPLDGLCHRLLDFLVVAHSHTLLSIGARCTAVAADWSIRRAHDAIQSNWGPAKTQGHPFGCPWGACKFRFSYSGSG